MQFYYVYVLYSHKDKKFYIGFTENLKKRYLEHQQGRVPSTASRLPIELIFYEAYKNKYVGRLACPPYFSEGGNFMEPVPLYSGAKSGLFEFLVCR